MNRITAIALAATTCFSTATTQAFDGDRRGFLLGVAGGLHSSDIEADGGGSLSGDETGVAVRLTVGGGITERIALYGLLESQADSDAAYGLFGFGGSYYFRGNGPSAYLFGAAGIGALTIDDEIDSGPDAGEDFETSSGTGLLFGAGYAVTQGLHIDGSVLVLEIEDDDNLALDVDYEIVSVRVMAGYTWY